MKVSINCKDWDLQEGTKFLEVVEIIREAKKEEPMIKEIRKKIGRDLLLFVLNGRFVPPDEYDSIEIQDGDDIRWVHPFAGG